MPLQVGEHGRDDFGIVGRGCVVVLVDCGLETVHITSPRGVLGRTHGNGKAQPPQVVNAFFQAGRAEAMDPQNLDCLH